MLVEAFMNTAGISYVDDYADLCDFNLSKHQKEYTVVGHVDEHDST